MCSDCPDWDECYLCEITNDSIPSACETPLDHTTADEDGVVVETLSIERGFWRASNKSEDILACYNADACNGGQTGADGFCAPGYQGPCENWALRAHTRDSAVCRRVREPSLASERFRQSFVPVALTLDVAHVCPWLPLQIALCVTLALLHHQLLTPARNARAQDAGDSWPPVASPLL